MMKNNDYDITVASIEQNIKNNIKLLLEIENTKVLYYGIQRLYENYKTNNAFNADLSLELFVEDEYKNCFDDEDTPLCQSMHKDFFEYMRLFCTHIMGENKGIIKEEIVKQSADFLQFYIDILKTNDNYINMYDLYGNIANDFNELLGSYLCYMFYSDSNGTKFLLSSDFKNETKLNMFDEIHYACKVVEEHKGLRSCPYDNLKNNTYYSSQDVIELKIANEEKSDLENLDENNDVKRMGALSICIDLKIDDYQDSHESIYIVVFCEKDCRDAEKRLIFPLCFRNKLKTLFERDIERLLSKCYNNSYDEVKKFNDDLKILHLTDLHISKKNYDDIINLVNANKQGFEKEKYDLLIISGDVIQGNGTANELEENYKLASDIIIKIARIIWSENDKLRNDWQKRIIIIPGNHDYAMMNELSAVQVNRKLQYGYASTFEGSIMAKFTYYIDFIRKLLGTPVGNMINSRLNEVRHYSSMGLTVCCLNSCCKANPLRTNKVKLDDTWINEQINSVLCNYEGTSICVVHHAPTYPINYFADKYKFNWDKIKKDNIKLDFELREIISYFIMREKIPQEKIETIKQISSDDKLFDELCRYNKSRLQYGDDFISTFISQSMGDISLSDNDNNDYNDLMTKLVDKFRFQYILAGHEHERRKTRYNEVDVYIGNQFYNKKDKKLCYAVLTLSNYSKQNKCYDSVSIDEFL